MSEGPEVKRIADELSSVLLGKKLTDVYGKRIDAAIKSNLLGADIKNIKTFGKNIVFTFSSNVFLRNHLMMWGKWRIYERNLFDRGMARPLPRSKWYRKGTSSKQVNMPVTNSGNTDVRKDPRVRLVLVTESHVAVQFNGPVIQFLQEDPSSISPIALLGPDPLNKKFERKLVLQRLQERLGKFVYDLLLDQTFVAGIGNKYKSEILFQTKICPFIRADELSKTQKIKLVNQIRETLLFGYHNQGRTRPVDSKERLENSWKAKHWVFRRAGQLCRICSITDIQMDHKRTNRVTYWCPNCQSCK
jgi:formamidopyrimidine-DNA glycosylase